MEDFAAKSACSEQPEQDESSPSPAAGSVDSCCGSCLESVARRIPVDYKNEALQCVKLAGPVFISQLMSFLIGFVSMVFCGHLGKTELAGVALAIAIVNVTGLSIGTGLATTCDTLISQTYGSGNFKRTGVILQRAILILLLACFPCWAVLINTQPLLLAVKQSPDVARFSQLYVKIFMAALPAAFLCQLQGRYLQNQGIMWPQVISGALANILNVIINYIFLRVLDLGLSGSAAANVISQYSAAVFLWAHICYKGLHKATWDGWSLDCLQEWGPFLRLAVPSMLMYCLECWLYEVVGVLAGTISKTELGAQSITLQVVTVSYAFPIGFSASASVRVGNALGAGNTELAKLSAKVCIVLATFAACLVGVCLGGLRDVIGYIFTTERDIIQRVADVMGIYCFIHVVEAIAAVTGGIVRGAGKQTFGAAFNLVGFYVIGLPIGISLMFPAKLGIKGFWFGLLISIFLQSVVFIAFLCKLSWKEVTAEALARAGVNIAEMDDKAFDSSETQAHVRRQSSCQNPFQETTEAVDSGQQTTASVALSVRQLVIRRGFAVLLMFVLLAAGVSISEALIREVQ